MSQRTIHPQACSCASCLPPRIGSRICAICAVLLLAVATRLQIDALGFWR